jgi:hypothetical protein
MKTYSELIKIDSFDDRVAYLECRGGVGDRTFGGYRYANQALYRSPEWKAFKNQMIIRDNACDLAHEQHPIDGYATTKSGVRKRSIILHHINPITIDDVLERRPCVFDPENVVCVTQETHNRIHYGKHEPPLKMVERKPYDTCPWRK